MDKFLLIVASAYFIWVMWAKKIPLVSLYGFFGLQWWFYWFFPYLLSIGFYPKNIFGGYKLNYDPGVQFYFFLFNAISLLCFALVYHLFYKKRLEEQATPSVSPDRSRETDRYKGALFVILLSMSLLFIVLAIMFPYMKYNWIVHSIQANLRNIYVGLFLFYMLIKPKKAGLVLLFLLFCASTVIYGGRLYLAILAASLFFYLYNSGAIKLRHIFVLFIAMVLLLNVTVLVRSGLASKADKLYGYMLMPIFAESVFSSYPGFAVTKMWANNEIKYYTYFGSYVVDPLMMFVPQVVFKQDAVAKEGYNVLGDWEAAHGGRASITPQGAYYYLAEAMEAAGVYGIVIVSAGFAFLCVFMEKLRFRGRIGEFIYYSFVGTFGFGFVKNQFSWCFRYFFQNIFAVLIFIAVFTLFWEGARNYKLRRASLAQN
jgi:hypothetical protein